MIKNNSLWITMNAPHLVPQEEVEIDDVTPATEDAIEQDWQNYYDKMDEDYKYYRDEIPEWHKSADY